MSKRQTRRTISFKAEVFERIRVAASYSGIAIARYAEEVLVARMDADGIPVPDRDRVLAEQDRRARVTGETFAPIPAHCMWPAQ